MMGSDTHRAMENEARDSRKPGRRGLAVINPWAAE
jgi:hypothetical protein